MYKRQILTTKVGPRAERVDQPDAHKLDKSGGEHQQTCQASVEAHPKYISERLEYRYIYI